MHQEDRGNAPLVHVVVGGSAACQAVELDGGPLMWHELRDVTPSAERLDDPTPERWAEFWRELDRLDVWDWDEHYEGCATDAFCAVEIEHEGRRVVMDGAESGYPPNFDAFCAAVSRLTGKEFFMSEALIDEDGDGEEL